MKGEKFIPLVVVAGLLAYQNSFTGPFIFDDVASIRENPTIRHLWPIWHCLSPSHGSWLTVEGRPLINLTLAINYALGGLQVWGYHALNLAIHILAGLTLLGVVRRTLLQPGLRSRFGATANELALATAVLWTVHPLQTESVTYIIQRAESIMGLLYLLTLYCFIRGTESRLPRLWYGLSVTACALGMASKEVMVSAPLMVLLYDRAFLSGSFREAWRRRGLLYLALASTWILLGLVLVAARVFTYVSTTAQQHFGVTWWEYLVTEPGVILYYLRLCVWPSPLSLDYGWPIAKTWASILPPTVVVVILLAASAWAWRKNPVWGFVGAWFFLILAPSSSVILLDSPAYEHRMYLPLAAVVVLGVMGIHALAPLQPGLVGWRGVAVVTVLVIGLGFLTWRRNQDYRSEFAIWQDTVIKCPDNPRAHGSLGTALGRLGRFQEATEHFEQALRLKPHYADAHNGLGTALLQEGKLAEAIDQYRQALRINPHYADAHNNLGEVLLRLGRVQEAIEHFGEALRIMPGMVEAHYNLGVVLEEAGEVPEAIAHYEQALRIQPGYPQAHYNLGNALLKMGKLGEAMGHWDQATRLNPDFAEAHYNLGVALMGLGRLPEAVEHLAQALRVKPNSAEAHNSLGAALMRLGRLPEAVEHYERALQIQPGSAEFHNNLGVALFRLGRLQEAVVHGEQALRLKPDYAQAHHNLGIILARMGRIQEAIGQYEQALRLKPDFAEARNELTRLRSVQ